MKPTVPVRGRNRALVVAGALASLTALTACEPEQNSKTKSDATTSVETVGAAPSATEPAGGSFESGGDADDSAVTRFSVTMPDGWVVDLVAYPLVATFDEVIADSPPGKSQLRVQLHRDAQSFAQGDESATPGRTPPEFVVSTFLFLPGEKTKLWGQRGDEDPILSGNLRKAFVGQDGYSGCDFEAGLLACSLSRYTTAGPYDAEARTLSVPEDYVRSWIAMINSQEVLMQYTIGHSATDNGMPVKCAVYVDSNGRLASEIGEQLGFVYQQDACPSIRLG